MLTPLINHTPKKSKKSLPYLAWFTLGIALLSVGACERCNPPVPEVSKKVPKGSSPVSPSNVTFTVHEVLQGTARTFTVHVQHTGATPSPLAACTLDFTLQAEGGAGSTLTYTDASNIQQTVTSQQKLTDFTTKQELASTDASLDIPMTLHPGPGVKQVTITIQLTSPGSTQTSTVEWEVATPDIITPPVIQAAQEAGATQDFLDLLEKLNQGIQLTPAEKTEAILEAAKLRNEEVVAALLQVPGVDINALGENVLTALHEAIQSGSLPWATLLLDKGADVNTPDKRGNTPLLGAIFEDNLDLVKLLLDKGADVNTPDKGGNNPLHIAIFEHNLNLVKLLLDKVADVNTPDKGGFRLLHLAAAAGHLDIVKFLVTHGANVNTPDKNGNTPLHIAIFEDNLDLVKLLLDKGADVNTPDKGGNNPLHLAAAAGHLDIVKFLVTHGANVNTPDKDGNNPLHLAVGAGNLNMVTFLLDNGADVNVPEPDNGLTLLHLAAFNNNLELVKLLVAHGANVKATNKNGEIPLNFTKDSGIKQFLVDQSKKAK